MNNNAIQNHIDTPLNLHGEVLNRIYRVWLFRKLVPVLLAEIAVVSFIVYKLAAAIFVRRVIENAVAVFFQNPPQIFSFFAAAFLHTPIPTKILLIAILIMAAFLIRHITQGILRLILVRENYFSKVK